VDGRTVTFESNNNQLVANDTNGFSDIFLWQDGSVQRVSLGVNGEQGDHASDYPAISGNGRYLFFRSRASNFISGTVRSNVNLYVKELATGRLALISRDGEGIPVNGANLGDHFTQVDADFSGRYVVFASAFAHFDATVTDNNASSDIFWADLDPDNNGDYFDSAPHIHLLSATAGGLAGNHASFEPTIAQNGERVAWLTRATDLAPGLASNSVADVVLAQLGTLPDGSIDPTARTLVAINRMGDDAETLTPQGARLARLDPWRDQVAFVTADDIPGTNDHHAGEDVYLSVGDGGDIDSRHMVWMSHAYDSSEPLAVSLGWDPLLPAGDLSQVAWVAHASPRMVDDLLLQRNAPIYPTGWVVVNWVEAATPSSAAVTNAILSADGRFALWTTSESYGFDVSGDTVNLFRRQIAPAQSVALTVDAVGGGADYIPAGVSLHGTMLYSPTTFVELTPKADVGYRFHTWVGVDGRAGMTATVIMYAARTITATFDAMTPPIASNLTLTTTEDTPLQGITLTISDPDPDENHTVTLAQLPSHGIANVVNDVTSYQPAQDFSGQDVFALQATDAYGLQLATPAEVTVHVMPVNDPPVAASAQGSGVNDGAAITLLVAVQDPDLDDSYTLAMETAPTAGSVQITSQLQGQSFAYTPIADFEGVDSFIFRITDSGNASITGTAIVTVTHIAIPPTVIPSTVIPPTVTPPTGTPPTAVPPTATPPLATPSAPDAKSYLRLPALRHSP
jgi:hypothetical protein